MTLPKAERLSSKTAISSLVSSGKWGILQPVRYCFVRNNGSDVNRILVSVPKKFFKRAVKRNLVKRRMRECYRLQKDLLNVRGLDIMFVYNSSDIVAFGFLKDLFAHILTEIDKRAAE